MAVTPHLRLAMLYCIAPDVLWSQLPGAILANPSGRRTRGIAIASLYVLTALACVIVYTGCALPQSATGPAVGVGAATGDEGTAVQGVNIQSVLPLGMAILCGMALALAGWIILLSHLREKLRIQGRNGNAKDS